MGSLGEAVVEVGADTTGFRKDVESGVNSAMGKASKSVQNIGKGMQSAGTKLSLAVTAPLVGLGIAAVRAQGDFETSMNLIAANLDGMTSQGKKQLADLAMTLGADTVFSAGEAADAMLELAKGGFNQAQIAGGGVQATMALAATEGLALADAATIVGNAMNAFGLEAKDAGKIADMLAAGSSASSASVASLAQGMGNVGPVAKTLGVSMGDVISTLSLFDQNALKGAEGGTALRNVLSRMTPQTKAAQSAFEKLGVIAADGTNKFYTAEGSLKSMGEISGILGKGLAGLGSDQERANVLMKAFGTYGQQAASILGSAGAGGFKKFSDAVATTGKAQELADARMNGTAGAIEKMRGSLETATLAIGQALAPVVVKVADGIGTLVDKFTTLSPTVQRIVVVFAAVAAAVGPVLVVLGTLVASVGAIAGALAGVSLAAAAPIAAFVLVGVAIGMLLAKSAKARAVVVDAFNQIRAAVAPALAEISAIITTTIIPAFQAMWPTIEKVGVVILKVFAGAVVGALKGALNVIVGVVKVIAGVIQVFRGIFTGDFSMVWAGLKSIVSGALQAVLGVVQVWFNVGILKAFRLGFSLLMGIVRGAWTLLRALFSGGVRSITGVMNGILRIITWPMRTAFNMARNYVSTGWKFIRGQFSGGVGGVRAVMGRIIQVVTFPIRTAISTARAIVTGGMAAIRGAFSAGVNAAAAIFRSLGAKIKGAIGNAKSLLSGIGRDIVAGLKSGIDGAAGMVMAAVDALVGKIPAKIRKLMGIASPSKVTTRLGRFIAQGLSRGILKEMPGVERAITRITKVFNEEMPKRLKSDKAIANWRKQHAQRLRKAQGDLAQALVSDARATYQAAVSQMRAYGAEVTKAARDFAALSNMNTDAGVTGGGIAAYLKTQADRLTAYGANLKKISGKVSKSLYDSIVQMGPEQGSAFAAALASASPAELAAVKAQQARIDKQAAALGANTSKVMHGAGVDAARGFMDGITRMVPQLGKAGSKMGRAFVAAMKKSLKIKSPSRVLNVEVGRMLPAGVAQGIDDNSETMMAAMRRSIAPLTDQRALGLAGAQPKPISLRPLPTNTGGGPITLDGITAQMSDQQVAALIDGLLKAASTISLRQLDRYDYERDVKERNRSSSYAGGDQ